MTELRNFTNDDLSELKRLNYPTASKDELQALIAEWNQKNFNGVYFEMFAILHENVLVGKASLYQRSEHMVSCGLEIYPEYQQKGFATSAYRNLLAFAREKHYAIAIAQVRTDNFASIALHRKLGFETDGYTYLNQKKKEVFIYIKLL